MSDMLDAVRKVMKLESFKDYLNWSVHNESEPTDYEAWSKGVENAIEANKDMIVEEIDKIGK